MATKMTCNLCGASVIGTVAEVLAWDAQHEPFCAKRTPNDGSENE